MANGTFLMLGWEAFSLRIAHLYISRGAHMNFEFDAADLPEVVRAHLEKGHCPSDGMWLVRPLENETQNCIRSMNRWLRGEEAPYPAALADVIWFGDDGVGNIFGWSPAAGEALLWNPEDEEAWHRGSVENVWQFVISGYAEASE